MFFFNLQMNVFNIYAIEYIKARQVDVIKDGK